MKLRGPWDWWRDELERCVPALPGWETAPRQEWKRLVREVPNQTVAEAEAALRVWLVRESWADAGKLAEPTVRHIHLRFLHAAWACEVQLHSGEPESPATRPEIFRWALLDCWWHTAGLWADEFV